MSHRLESEFGLHEGAVLSLDVRGGRFVTAGADSLIRLFASDGKSLGTDRAHEDIVKSVRLGPDGRVASGSRDRTVRVWDPDRDRSGEIGRHDEWVMGVAWSPDGTRVASVSEDGTLRVWDADGTGETVRADLRYPGNGVDWGEPGIAVAGGNRRLYLFTDDGTQLREIRGGSQMLWGTRFSPDGTRVAWVSRDRVLRIATAHGDDVVEASGHGAQIWSVSWHPAGDRLVTASADGTARLWAADGAPVERIDTPAWVREGAWLDGRLLLAGEDGTVRAYLDDGDTAAVPDRDEPQEASEACPHLDPQVTGTDRNRCEECGSSRSLRLCLTCGHVGCCESQLAHGTKHWEETGHPNTTPVPVGPLGWRWCYACDAYVKRVA